MHLRNMQCMAGQLECWMVVSCCMCMHAMLSIACAACLLLLHAYLLLLTYAARNVDLYLLLCTLYTQVCMVATLLLFLMPLVHGLMYVYSCLLSLTSYSRHHHTRM